MLGSIRICATALVVCLPLVANAQTNWNHNGSIVTLYADGPNRQFLYSIPRPGLPVTSGTKLFAGRKDGNTYSGTAYAFSSKCGAVSYRVSGSVEEDQRSVTMYGKKPMRDGSCRVVRVEDDILTFTFIAPEIDTATTEPETEQRETLICLHPVFTEERRLTEEIDGTEATTKRIAQAINFLRAKYCMTVAGEPDYDESTSLNETCVQHSGMFRGERVYWGGCFE